MSLKQPVMTIAAAALCVAANGAAVSAQESCGILHNRLIGNYQTLGPKSREYVQLLDRYNSNCLSGSSGMPTSLSPYKQPAPLDPGAGGEGSGGGERRLFHEDYRSHRG